MGPGHCPGGSEERPFSLLGNQAMETTDPKELEFPWESHTAGREGLRPARVELIFLTL